MKYRKKPVEINAFRLGHDEHPEWFKVALKTNIKETTNNAIGPETGPGEGISTVASVEIETLEGNMKAHHGDYIIKGVNGEIYPCKADIFDKTYEKV